MNQKMYVIVRGDLPAGLQVAQACHALRAFADEHPEEERIWHEGSNNLVVLQVPSRDALLQLEVNLAASACVPTSRFEEDDLNGEVTAIAALEGPTARPLLRHLELALAPPRAA